MNIFCYCQWYLYSCQIPVVHCWYLGKHLSFTPLSDSLSMFAYEFLKFFVVVVVIDSLGFFCKIKHVIREQRQFCFFLPIDSSISLIDTDLFK